MPADKKNPLTLSETLATLADEIVRLLYYQNLALFSR